MQNALSRRLVLKLILRRRISDAIWECVFQADLDMFPNCRPSQSLWYADVLIHCKKTIRRWAFPRLMAGDPFWGVAPLLILRAGVTRSTVWETLPWEHGLCVPSSAPLPCGSRPWPVQICPSPHPLERTECAEVHRPCTCWVLMLCSARRKPFRQLGLGCARGQARQQRSASRLSPGSIRTGFINKKKETICYGLAQVLHGSGVALRKPI